MNQRGRKSAAQLSVISTEGRGRPAPPDDLSASERALWADITGSRAIDFFDEATIPLLVEYCRLKTQVDMVANRLADFKPEWLDTVEGVKQYKDLTSVQDKAQGRMIGLARSMRLTQQARYVPDKASNRPQRAAKPWEGA